MGICVVSSFELLWLGMLYAHVCTSCYLNTHFSFFRVHTWKWNFGVVHFFQKGTWVSIVRPAWLHLASVPATPCGFIPSPFNAHVKLFQPLEGSWGMITLTSLWTITWPWKRTPQKFNNMGNISGRELERVTAVVVSTVLSHQDEASNPKPRP